MPHVAKPRVWHFPEESQQPDGHDVASQTHLPCVLQSWLAPHMAHTPPPRPQAELDGVVLHTPLAQHPLHDVPPQLQAPALHAWPPAQVPHELPADPHALVDWSAVRTHVVPWQQPPGHEEGVQVHAPAALHVWLAPHVPHATPPVPHFVADWLPYVTQVAPSQQPIGHDVASHTHEPFGPHSWPCAHATHAAPVAPHVAFFDVWHEPPSSQQPVHPPPPQEQA